MSVVYGENLQLMRPAETKPVIIKTVNFKDFSPKPMLAALREARILGVLCPHDNIVDLLDVAAGDAGVYIILEQCGRELGVVGSEDNPSLKEIARITVSLLEGLAYMHNLGIYHLDIKDENILMSLDGQTPKYIDFGFSVSRTESSVQQMQDSRNDKTSGFCCPECFDPYPAKKSQICVYLAARDVYALGMTIIRSFFKPKYDWNREFRAAAITKTTERVFLDYFSRKLVRLHGSSSDTIEKDLADLLLKMIEPEMDARIKVQATLQRTKANHNWLVMRDGVNRLVAQRQEQRRQERQRALQAKVQSVIGSSGVPASVRRGRRPVASRGRRRTMLFRCRACSAEFSYKPVRCRCGLPSATADGPTFERIQS